jgi:hypothetical protein
MKLYKLSPNLLGLVIGLGAPFATAAPLNITNIDGSWVNATPPSNITSTTNVTGSGTDSIRWGGLPFGIGEGSGYDFTPAANITGAPLGTPFVLGVFTHINQPIPFSITGVQYTFQFTTNGNPGSLANTFTFDHNETPNNPNNPSPADDDIVTISPFSFNSLITVGSDVYYFNLLGFSTNGGTTISSVFNSPEGSVNNANLYGIVTAQPLNLVPAPATAWLLLPAMGWFSIRRQTKSTK